LLAINIAGQTYLWEVLHHLATQRSLYGQMLDILMKAIQIFGTTNFHPKSCNVYMYIHAYMYECMLRRFKRHLFNRICDMNIYILDGLLICLSESGLMQAMLLNHNLARLHISFVHNNLRDSQIFVLQVRYFNSYSYD